MKTPKKYSKGMENYEKNQIESHSRNISMRNNSDCGTYVICYIGNQFRGRINGNEA